MLKIVKNRKIYSDIYLFVMMLNVLIEKCYHIDLNIFYS